MPKNVVVCIDGTGNEIVADETNVLRLARMLIEQPGRQTFYYDPGVGTQGAPTASFRSSQELVKLMGLAVGVGVYDKIGAAYRFLMDAYEPGDELYLFGFSRGAYVARAVAAMVRKIGILERSRSNLVPYAVKLYSNPLNLRVASAFRKAFCDRRATIRFLGVWDTVKSVYQFEPSTFELRGVALPGTFRNPSVRVVRHALAIDERRRFYRTNVWADDTPGQDVKQVWFAGVHSDVGGSYPEPQSGLSKVSLRWMLREAKAHGLLIDPDREARMIPDAQTAGGNYRPPDPLAEIHTSLKGWWWLPEAFPKRRRDGLTGQKSWKLYLPLGEPRFIPEGSILHDSVLTRLNGGVGYAPPNLPTSYRVEH